ncbi:MAG: DUF3800 domain-containing protein [Acidobacteria bacterium]|nr:MAG: DUF3800 domain-containing protein [Acidobacteriota bacterium]REK04158.1 MAG: DUF3800 domain-containing protein [Acidobacteriota bacterium]REK15320.1 MAG: DUF3800 domain-containing protein [Acidobacteriota bacterium]REK46410.1 MAG: DUF3800 domain-containing protein [Acidobacteriota bacterium]
MLVFIDESGDAGLKLDGGSTPFLTVVIVLFKDLDAARSADQRIQDLKQNLGVSGNWEFKFNKASKMNRLRFLGMAKNLEFEIFGLVLNKAKLISSGSATRHQVYELACSRVCKSARKALKNATVVIDGAGSRDFRRSLASQLRRNLRSSIGTSHIKKLKFEDSKKNNLLQLADMVCGAIARSYSKKSDALEYRSVLRSKEVSVEIWPE